MAQMKPAELFLRSLNKASKTNKWVGEPNETGMFLSLPFQFSTKGKAHFVSLTISIENTEHGQVYDEYIQVFTNAKRTQFSKIPARLYLDQLDASPEITQELTSELNGLHKVLTKKFKYKAPKVAKTTEVSTAVVTEAPRRPGRPRKEVLVSETPVVKRPRGRPRKTQPIMQAE